MNTLRVLECGSPLPLLDCGEVRKGAGGFITKFTPVGSQSARGLAQSKTCRRFLTSLVFLTAANFARTQPFSLESFTVDGGGGTSSGGSYTLSGTIGQPDAGRLSGGSFMLEGGFWLGVTTVAIPGGPTLFIQQLGLEVRVSWTPATPGFVLQQAGTLEPSSWGAAPSGAQNPATMPARETARFYRLVKP